MSDFDIENISMVSDIPLNRRLTGGHWTRKLCPNWHSVGVEVDQDVFVCCCEKPEVCDGIVLSLLLRSLGAVLVDKDTAKRVDSLFRNVEYFMEEFADNMKGIIDAAQEAHKGMPEEIKDENNSPVHDEFWKDIWDEYEYVKESKK